ncbi:putative methyltransferase [Mycena olivaceomarginata]|nr:putative methyltransferase [Mycena olivaceomarginata]
MSTSVYTSLPHPLTTSPNHNASSTKPSVPTQPSFGIDSPLGLLYATLKGKHDLWTVLLKTTEHNVPSGTTTSTSYGIDIFRTGDQSGNAPEATWQNVASAGFTSRIVLHTASFTETLPFKDGVFGVVTSSLAVHNADKEGRRKAVGEMARVCATGGYVVIVDLAGYVGGYEEVLREMGWTEVSSKWGGAGVMFGAWPCLVLKARKPE